VGRRELRVRRESWPIAGTFRIARGAKTVAEVVVAEIHEGTHVGRGECAPYARYGQSVDGTVEAIEALGADVAAGLNRSALQDRLPASAARNALDCALWDLDAKVAERRAWELEGLAAPGVLTTAFTLGIDSLEALGAAARTQAHRPLLKIKLAGDGDDVARVRAVRDGAPAARIVVDANESWTEATFSELAQELAALGVLLIEQPLPEGRDACLSSVPHPVPLCADESCHGLTALPELVGRYDVINIKLDRTGGLTEALRVRAEARRLGLGVMVGCIVGTSLAMAPALLVAAGADFVDLDGPLLLARDRDPGLRYDGSEVHPPDAALWG